MLKVNFGEVLILWTLLCLTLFIFLANASTPYQQFSDQTQSFLSGHLDISSAYDTVSRNGKYYWPLGPFPSIILIPFQTILGSTFNQTPMQIIMILLIIFYLYKLTRIKKYDKKSSLFLIYAFFLASPIIGLITTPSSWFYAQVITVTILTILLYEWETQRRMLVLGLFSAALIATRHTASFILIYFVIFLLRQPVSLKGKIAKLFPFFLPLLIAITLLMLFNFIRSGNIFDSGYTTANVGSAFESIRSMGIISIVHIPSNVYYYFLASVQPITNGTAHLIFPYFTFSPWGLSFFIVGPFFLYSLKSLRNTNSYIRSLWLVVCITLCSLLIYYASGWAQFGPRYTADFLPILYLLTLYSLNPPKLTILQKTIIVLSSLFNIYLLLGSLYLNYKLL